MLTSSLMKQARKQFGLTLNDVMEYTGIKKETLLKIEGNQHVASQEEREKLTSYYFPYFRMMKEKKKEKSFYHVFQEKGYKEVECLEIKRLDLLVDALVVQEQLLKQ